MSTLYHLPHIFRFFLINVAFRVRRNVHHRQDDFLFNGSNRENFMKIPRTNLDRGKKTLRCFELVFFQDDCPYFLGKLFSGNGFIPKCITKFAICTWCALNTVSSCFIFLFSPFSLHLSQNWFLFRNFSSFFLFFLGVITDKLCFFKILNIALFHDSLVCNDINARTFMVGFFEKNTFFETEINEILISHLNRFHSTWARIHPSF